jgi:hypothetical protein
METDFIDFLKFERYLKRESGMEIIEDYHNRISIFYRWSVHFSEYIVSYLYLRVFPYILLTHHSFLPDRGVIHFAGQDEYHPAILREDSHRRGYAVSSRLAGIIVQ